MEQRSKSNDAAVMGIPIQAKNGRVCIHRQVRRRYYAIYAVVKYAQIMPRMEECAGAEGMGIGEEDYAGGMDTQTIPSKEELEVNLRLGHRSNDATLKLKGAQTSPQWRLRLSVQLEVISVNRRCARPSTSSTILCIRNGAQATSLCIIERCR